MTPTEQYRDEQAAKFNDGQPIYEFPANNAAYWRGVKHGYIKGFDAGVAYIKEHPEEIDPWVSVEERLPEPKKKVQIFCILGADTGYYWGEGEGIHPSPDPCKGWSIMNVTHWKPLPSAPLKLSSRGNVLVDQSDKKDEISPAPPIK